MQHVVLPSFRTASAVPQDADQLPPERLAALLAFSLVAGLLQPPTMAAAHQQGRADRPTPLPQQQVQMHIGWLLLHMDALGRQ
jgi:hypothetical protein